MPSHGTPLTIDQFAQLLSEVVTALPRDLYPQVASRWGLKGGLLTQELDRVLSRREGGGTFLVAVDFSKSFNDMLAESGCDLLDARITPANFPIEGVGGEVLELELIRLGERLTTKGVDSELHWMRFHAENLQALLAFAARNQYEPRNYSIVARASVWRRPDGVEYVPELVREGNKRCLRLHALSDEWDGNCCFLARHLSKIP